METKFRDFLAEQLKNPDFKREYEALEIDAAIMQALIDARKTSGITPQLLSEKTGIHKSYITRIENGNANPSIRTLKRLAEGMGMKLKLEFQPV